MSIIYAPAGAAREYAPWAVNLDDGCGHGCRYCYAPGARRITDPAAVARFFAEPRPRRDVIKRLAAEAPKFAQAHPGALVLLSFTSDPYQPIEAEHRLCLSAQQILMEQGLRVVLLTKAGDLATRDLTLLESGRDWFGITLTTLDPERARLWEPLADPPEIRVRALWAARHGHGLRTWVSLEPVIYINDTLEIIPRLAGRVKHFAVGRMNHLTLAQARAIDPNIDPVDWACFHDQAIYALEHHGYRRVGHNLPDEPGLTYYIKEDLAKAKKKAGGTS